MPDNSPHFPPLIEARALADLIEENPAAVKLLDASYNQPAPAYPHFRIGTAQAFDIDAIADPDHELAHMLPTPAQFSEAMAALGIGHDDHVVIYDQTGIAMAAARAWWMFRVFGHKKVQVLNGGLPYWQAQGFPLVTDPSLKNPAPSSPSYQVRFQPDLVADLAQVGSRLTEDSHCIIDVRDTTRFAGIMPAPRPGVRSGHMPGSVNLPFMALLDPAIGGLKPDQALKELLSPYLSAPNITVSCGSGVTACVAALAFAKLGRSDVAIYDGSWSEWGQEKSGTAVKTAVG